VIGDALRNGDFADQRTAALLYAGNFLFASTAFSCSGCGRPTAGG
jgi:hypothetical protein